MLDLIWWIITACFSTIAFILALPFTLISLLWLWIGWILWMNVLVVLIAIAYHYPWTVEHVFLSICYVFNDLPRWLWHHVRLVCKFLAVWKHIKKEDDASSPYYQHTNQSVDQTMINQHNHDRYGNDLYPHRRDGPLDANQKKSHHQLQHAPWIFDRLDNDQLRIDDVVEDYDQLNSHQRSIHDRSRYPRDPLSITYALHHQHEDVGAHDTNHYRYDESCRRDSLTPYHRAYESKHSFDQLYTSSTSPSLTISSELWLRIYNHDIVQHYALPWSQFISQCYHHFSDFYRNNYVSHQRHDRNDPLYHS